MQFGNYQIIRKIGTGGMAQVFLAERLGLEGFHRRVALKCILPQMTRDERFVQMFINEARLGSQLHHPNIIEIQDFNKVNDVYYIAMEYVEGVDLGDLISHMRAEGWVFPAGLAIDIMLQALEGLGYAHEASTEDGQPMNIIHRDIKPSNLLLTKRGTVKIADFGIAKAATNAYQTRTAEVTKGSLAYMSPEQITREAVPKGCSDLFALGAVFFEMLALRPLFEGDNVPSIMFKVAQVEIERDLEEISSQYPEIEPILRIVLSREQGDRYQVAAEMAKALRAIRDKFEDSPTIKESVIDYFAKHPREESEEAAAEELEEAATSLFSDPRTNPGVGGDAVQLMAEEESDSLGASAVYPAPAQIPANTPPDGTLAHFATEPVKVPNRWVGPVVLVSLLLMLVGAYAVFRPAEASMLSITSTPSGAQVMVNGQLLNSVTPSRIQLPDAETAEIRLELVGYKAYIESISYKPGELISRRPRLEPETSYGGFDLSSDPVGAAVSIDGKAIGAVTPFETSQLEAGRSYVIGLSLEGYKSWRQEVKIQGEQTHFITAALVEEVKVAPVVVVPTTKPVRERPVSPTTTTKVPVKVESKPVGMGELVLNAIPPECDVYVDGAKNGSLPKSLRLSAGSHNIALVRFDGSARKEFTVNIPAGGTVTKVWDFFDKQWISD